MQVPQIQVERCMCAEQSIKPLRQKHAGCEGRISKSERMGNLKHKTKSRVAGTGHAHEDCSVKLVMFDFHRCGKLCVHKQVVGGKSFN